MSYKTIIEQVVKDKQKFINLDDNSLKEIPSELFELSNIIKVNLSNNKISEISTDIHKLQHLEILTLFSNRLNVLPVCLNQLQSLVRLTLRLDYQHLNSSNNAITELPQGFGTIPSLEYLDLSINKITTLSANFGYLSTLRVLHISNNLLTALPKEFGNLGSLEMLVARDNQLTTLPDEIALVTLNIQGNKFTTPPLCLPLTTLDHKHSLLLLAGNPWIKPVKAILKNGGVGRMFEAMRDTNSWSKLVSVV